MEYWVFCTASASHLSTAIKQFRLSSLAFRADSKPKALDSGLSGRPRRIGRRVARHGQAYDDTNDH